MFRNQVLFEGIWYDVGPAYPTRGDAEWACGKWKADSQCYKGHQFRQVELTPLEEAQYKLGESLRAVKSSVGQPPPSRMPGGYGASPDADWDAE